MTGLFFHFVPNLIQSGYQPLSQIVLLSIRCAPRGVQA